MRFVKRFLAQSGSDRLTGLLLGQLDAFNRISTTFGRERSEVFCEEFAQKLRTSLPPGTHLIRLSQRRFAVLLTMDSISKIVAVGAEMAEGRQPQLKVGEDTFLVDITIGIAVFPTHADDAESLFRRAELALKEARDNDMTFEIYRPDATQQQAALWKFESELDRAVKQGELETYYQPKLSISDNRIAGCEALVRWRAQSGRLISPGDFIPLAERTGSVVDITWIVFDQVAADAAAWGHLPKPFSVAVNISPQVIDDTNFVPRLKRLKGVLDEYEIDLTLEITEDSLVEGGESIPKKLQLIREQDVDLAIDDFGKGYSSLTYLKDIPATEIKVDKRFVGTISVDTKDQHIVKAIVELAHAFGMRVVAEGVDSQESLIKVAELGCEMIQGFFIARPMRGCSLIEWIENYSPKTYPELVDASGLRLLSNDAQG